MLKHEYDNLLADVRNLITGATEYCNCSKATIQRAIRDGRLKVTKPIGMNKLMFRKDWLDRWLK